MQRIAAPMIGGMVTALVLTLLVLPAAYYLWRSRTLKTLEHTTSQTDTPTAP
jgi:Cu(I)/Ag(I) efflux system membrane protein CusA/SilA